MVDGVKEPTNIPTMPSLIVGKQTGKILHLGVRNKSGIFQLIIIFDSCVDFEFKKYEH